MPSGITAYRVFIASPGGLQEERDAFRSVIQNYNESDAIERGIIFLPVGWEITLGGVGRPQQTINEEVRGSDYFVLVLWDRWGSAPQVEGQGRYTSGSEEEFDVARECHGSGTMREILILFKGVDPTKINDPGPQLNRVLEFREQLEKEKSLLFETFDEPGAFRERLRRHLARWVRDHEEGVAPRPGGVEPRPPIAPAAAETPPISIEAPTEAPQEASSELVRGAEELAKEGRVTEAERAFAKAIVGEADLDSLNRYGAFLVEKGSLASAEEVFVRLRDLARQRQIAEWVVASLNNLAEVYVAQGKFDEAESSYRDALEIRENTLGPNDPDVAVSLNNLAGLYTSLRRFDEAEPLFKRALEIQGVTLAS